MFDIEKFRTPQSRGIFEGDPTGFAEWSKWADSLRQSMRHMETKDRYSSMAIPDKKTYLDVLRIALQNPESATHVLTKMMLQGGASWHQLTMLRDLTSWRSHSSDAGRFYRQIADWTNWYEDKLDPKPRLDDAGEP